MDRVLKSIFSSPLLIVRFLKKSKLDNFTGGLIFGALFSLIVNVVTINIQEAVQKQRVLEALEYEIFNNATQAESTIKNNSGLVDKKERIDYYHNFLKYSDNVGQSNEFLKYGLNLDPKVQSQIHAYYAVSVIFNNEILSKNDRLMEFQLGECYLNDGGFKDTTNTQCVRAFNYFFILESQAAKRVFDQSIETLKVFHPTKDRLSNPFLKFLMGDQSIGALRNGAVQ